MDRNLPSRIQHLLSQDRRFGSRDRRLYRELLYTAVRYWPWIESKLDGAPVQSALRTAWLAADIPATRSYKETSLADWPALPPTLAERAAHLDEEMIPLPPWVAAECPGMIASPEVEALFSRAPLWVRLQSEGANEAVETEFNERNWAFERGTVLANTWRITADVDVTQSEAYRAGLIEFQDLGSQLVLASANIAPGQHWFDACAGAGGKTLQLARMLGPAGKVSAYDIRPDALAELDLRARRAGIRNIEILSKLPTNRRFDGVLVDAPCTGSGTWRRSPHLKWTTSETDISEAAGRQLEILTAASALVGAGGSLIYATCSFNRTENEHVIAKFLASQSAFLPEAQRNRFGIPDSPAPGLAILPSLHDTDAFYTCQLRRQN